VADRLEATFDEISRLLKQAGLEGPSYFNICLTDGQRLIATRYCTDEKLTPETMHYALSKGLVMQNKPPHQLKNHQQKNCVVSSEKLTDLDATWQTVPVNHMMIIDVELNVQFRAL
jgi:glutamine amidotransferase